MQRRSSASLAACGGGRRSPAPGLTRARPPSPTSLAVLPSLLAVALFLPWSFGWGRPGSALLYLGALIMLSPLVNRALGDAARDFLRLRLHPSIGLGTLTIVVGLRAPRVL